MLISHPKEPKGRTRLNQVALPTRTLIEEPVSIKVPKMKP